MFNLALAKPARGQATILTPTANVAPIIAVRQNAWPRHARSPVALVALSNRAQARCCRAQAHCCKRPSGPALSNGAQARSCKRTKRAGARHHWAGEAGSLLESLLEDFGSLCIFVSFLLSSFSSLFFSASRSAAFTPLWILLSGLVTCV